MAEIYKAPSGKEYTILSRNPAMYPKQPGPNYRGELQGMLYDPWSDKYMPNPKEQEQFLIDMGVKDPVPKPATPVTPLEMTAYTVGGGLLGQGATWLASKGAESMGWGAAKGTTTGATTGATGSSAVGGGAGGVTGTESTGGLLGNGGFSLGSVVPAAGAALGAYLMADSANDIYKGKGTSTKSDIAWGINPLTAWAYWPAKFGGLLDHKSTKDYQKERQKALAKADPAYAKVRSILDDDSQQAIVKAAMDKAYAATDEGYRGWYDDPTTEQNDWTWVNKLSEGKHVKHNAEGFATLGAGDVINNPWFFENIPGWGDAAWETKAQIAEDALRQGNPYGNKGFIDFKPEEEQLKNWIDLISGVK